MRCDKVVSSLSARGGRSLRSSSSPVGAETGGVTGRRAEKLPEGEKGQEPRCTLAARADMLEARPEIIPMHVCRMVLYRLSNSGLGTVVSVAGVPACLSGRRGSSPLLVYLASPACSALNFCSGVTSAEDGMPARNGCVGNSLRSLCAEAAEANKETAAWSG